ncbi:MAG TPA: hypothetical protein VM243_18305 [Phycisphaerae bacterium]|nr:hypothetical protein [Phycisphaerae bacterium]
MSTGADQLQIRRIYSSSPAKAATISVAGAARARFSVLGVLHLLVAGVWLYVAWWPADRLIITNLSTTGLIHLSATGGLDGLFGSAPSNVANPAPPEGTEAVYLNAKTARGAPDKAARAEALAESERTLTRIGVTMETWFVLVTIVGGWLALCGGAAAAGIPVLDAGRRRQLLRVAIVLGLVAAGIAIKLWKGGSGAASPLTVVEIAFVAVVMLVAWSMAVALPRRAAGRTAAVLGLILIGGIALTAMQYGRGYPAGAPRVAAALGMVIAALIGAVAARRLVGLQRVAVVMVLLAAVGTMILLKIAGSLGSVHTHTLDVSTYAWVGVVPASYAAALLAALALRLR